MVNLLDIMRQAQAGMGLQTLSRQFGLAPNDAQRAIEALLPAFSLAFLRSAHDPAGFARLAGEIASGRYAPSFAAAGLPRPGGDDLVRTLFGSADVTRQVAEQASRMTGVAVGVLQAMMPAVASALAGGLFRHASVEGFADLLRQWSDTLRTASAGAPAPPPKRDEPWAAWFDLMSAGLGGRPAAPPPPRQDPAATPFDVWARFMNGLVGAGAKPEPPPPPAQPNPFEALVRMFDAGREMQEQHLAAFRSILDAGMGARQGR